MDKDLIYGTIEKLEAAANVLYKEKANEGIAMLKDVIMDISVIASEMTDEELRARLLQEALSPALQAMEEQDAIGLADVITYELTAILKELI